MDAQTDEWLNQYYDAYPRIEELFQERLDRSLNPRRPDLLFELVAEFDLPTGATILDLGSGEGKHAIRLATDNPRATVWGIDPVERHIEISNARLAAAAEADPTLHDRVHFAVGTAEGQFPVGDGGADLVWCRDVLVHVEKPEPVYQAVEQVLRPSGRALVYQMFGTDRLCADEARWLWKTMGVVASSADPVRTVAAIEAAGLVIEQQIELTSEWAEYSEEKSGQGTRSLLHYARLMRQPEPFIAEFGRPAYDIMVGDCLWHIYILLGKMAPRAFVLTKAG